MSLCPLRLAYALRRACCTARNLPWREVLSLSPVLTSPMSGQGRRPIQSHTATSVPTGSGAALVLWCVPVGTPSTLPGPGKGFTEELRWGPTGLLATCECSASWSSQNTTHVLTPRGVRSERAEALACLLACDCSIACFCPWDLAMTARTGLAFSRCAGWWPCCWLLDNDPAGRCPLHCHGSWVTGCLRLLSCGLLVFTCSLPPRFLIGFSVKNKFGRSGTLVLHCA